MRLSLCLTAIVVLSLTACGGASAEATAAAKAINESADRCLVTVRDQRTRYSETPACNALGSLAMTYMQATQGGNGSDATELLYVGAQRMAWTAVAFSESCGGGRPQIW